MRQYRFRVIRIERYERAVRFRIPFRFGAATVSSAPQAFVRARIELADGSRASGAAAEMMMPKWFDKSSGRSASDNVSDLRRSLADAAEAYAAERTLRTAFDHYAAHGQALRTMAEARGSNALTAGFGASLIDRAVLDALCRHAGVSFWSALRSNLPAMDASRVAADLGDFDLTAFLRALEPRTEMAVRHTVGLLDAIGGDATSVSMTDGLPRTLEEVIAVHRPRYFKLKLSGTADSDVKRLESIAAMLDGISGPYHVTLDGNEQFDTVDELVALGQSIARRPTFARFAASVLWIEQPLPRDIAGETSVAAVARWRPVVIDESDATPDAFLRARALGYTGVSSKSCKGLYKSILNAARCTAWNTDASGPRFFVSGEDLTAQAGLSLQQDLALSGLLGLAHVERNGHHYVDGFAGQGAPKAEAQRFLAAHADLYHSQGDEVGLSIRDGNVRFASLAEPGYASATEPDWESLEPVGPTVAIEP